MVGKCVAIAAAAAMVSAMPAIAGDISKPSVKAKDPNQVICEKQEVLGSRLASKKVCMTRSEWAERRRLDRQEIDKAQVSRGSCDGCP